MGLRSEIQAIYQFTTKGARRAARAAGVGGDWSPASLGFPIFRITGGPVEVSNLFGVVVTTFTGAATPLVSFIPAGGIANAIAVIAVAAAYAANSLLVWDGSLTPVSGVLRATPALGHNQAQDSVGTAATSNGFKNPITFIPGDIVIVNAVPDAAGQADWYVTYRALTPASQLVAVP